MDEKNSTEEKTVDDQTLRLFADAADAVDGVDLTGLEPEQAYALGHMVGDLMQKAEARGYQRAIDALRDTVASQGSWLWFTYGESGLLEVADWLEKRGPAERPQ